MNVEVTRGIKTLLYIYTTSNILVLTHGFNKSLLFTILEGKFR